MLVGVGRGILGGQIAPALERAERPGPHRNHSLVEHEVAAADAIGVGEGANVAQRLPAGDLALDHPVERAVAALAAQDLVDPLRHHARRVLLLEGDAEAAVLHRLLLDPFGEVGDRVAADAELEKMQGHRGGAIRNWVQLSA